MSLQCRICLSEDTRENLIVPCKCNGTSKYIHRTCLDQWRLINPESKNFKQCNTCMFEYEMVSNIPPNVKKVLDKELKKCVRHDNLFLSIISISIAIVIGLLIYKLFGFRLDEIFLFISYYFLTIWAIFVITGILTTSNFMSHFHQFDLANLIATASVRGVIFYSDLIISFTERRKIRHNTRIYGVRNLTEVLIVKDFGENGP